jgi:hypothetical protein
MLTACCLVIAIATLLGAGIIGIWLGYQIGRVSGVNWGNKYPRGPSRGKHDEVGIMSNEWTPG